MCLRIDAVLNVTWMEVKAVMNRQQSCHDMHYLKILDVIFKTYNFQICVSKRFLGRCFSH